MLILRKGDREKIESCCCEVGRVEERPEEAK